MSSPSDLTPADIALIGQAAAGAMKAMFSVGATIMNEMDAAAQALQQTAATIDIEAEFTVTSSQGVALGGIVIVGSATAAIVALNQYTLSLERSVQYSPPSPVIPLNTATSDLAVALTSYQSPGFSGRVGELVESQLSQAVNNFIQAENAYRNYTQNPSGITFP